MDDTLARRLGKLLAEDEAGRGTPRLMSDASRLFARVRKLIKVEELATTDEPALELACHALQLPFRAKQPPAVGKFGQTNLRERSQQAVELMLRDLTKLIDETLLERTAELLLELANTRTDDKAARILADAINLEDFGITGIIAVATQGQGLAILREGFAKRDAYGYWDARLRDGFHFEASRRIAGRRLASAKETLKALDAEAEEDGVA